MSTEYYIRLGTSVMYGAIGSALMLDPLHGQAGPALRKDAKYYPTFFPVCVGAWQAAIAALNFVEGGKHKLVAQTMQAVLMGVSFCARCSLLRRLVALPRHPPTLLPFLHPTGRHTPSRGGREAALAQRRCGVVPGLQLLRGAGGRHGRRQGRRADGRRRGCRLRHWRDSEGAQLGRRRGGCVEEKVRRGAERRTKGNSLTHKNSPR